MKAFSTISAAVSLTGVHAGDYQPLLGSPNESTEDDNKAEVFVAPSMTSVIEDAKSTCVDGVESIYAKYSEQKIREMLFQAGSDKSGKKQCHRDANGKQTCWHYSMLSKSDVKRCKSYSSRISTRPKGGDVETADLFSVSVNHKDSLDSKPIVDRIVYENNEFAMYCKYKQHSRNAKDLDQGRYQKEFLRNPSISGGRWTLMDISPYAVVWQRTHARDSGVRVTTQINRLRYNKIYDAVSGRPITWYEFLQMKDENVYRWVRAFDSAEDNLKNALRSGNRAAAQECQHKIHDMKANSSFHGKICNGKESYKASKKDLARMRTGKSNSEWDKIQPSRARDSEKLKSQMSREFQRMQELQKEFNKMETTETWIWWKDPALLQWYNESMISKSSKNDYYNKYDKFEYSKENPHETPGQGFPIIFRGLKDVVWTLPRSEKDCNNMLNMESTEEWKAKMEQERAEQERYNERYSKWLDQKHEQEQNLLKEMSKYEDQMQKLNNEKELNEKLQNDWLITAQDKTLTQHEQRIYDLEQKLEMQTLQNAHQHEQSKRNAEQEKISLHEQAKIAYDHEMQTYQAELTKFDEEKNQWCDEKMDKYFHSSKDKYDKNDTKPSFWNTPCKTEHEKKMDSIEYERKKKMEMEYQEKNKCYDAKKENELNYASVTKDKLIKEQSNRINHLEKKLEEQQKQIEQQRKDMEEIKQLLRRQQQPQGVGVSDAFPF